MATRRSERGTSWTPCPQGIPTGENTPKAPLMQATFLHQTQHSGTHVSRGPNHGRTGSLQGLDLCLGSTFAPGDDGSGMAHTTTRRRSNASNKAHHRLVLGVVCLDEVSSVLLGLTSDLTDHHNALGLRILQEPLQAVNEIGAVERVTSNPDASSLAEPRHSGLVDRFVGQGARARYDTDLALLVNVSRHDPNLALTRLDNSRAVRPNEPGGGLGHERLLHSDHVLLGDPLSDAHHQWNLRIQRLKNRRGSAGWRDVNHGGISTGLLDSLCNILEYRQAHVLGPSLLGVDATNHLSAIRNGLLRVERPLFARQALTDHLGVLVNKNMGSGREWSTKSQCWSRRN
mmetsp:Transcript_4922/g.10845  ORF Transcript_4922/g.10845 Transcript_4922/m.10845 type:complete len:344 (+) Transcript_4922:27-1058(+)